MENDGLTFPLKIRRLDPGVQPTLNVLHTRSCLGLLAKTFIEAMDLLLYKYIYLARA
jgi:hypothetical protein